MMNARSFNNNQNWTTEQVINLSRNLAIAYSSGGNQPQSNADDDNWTTEKFIHLGQTMARAYSLGL